MRLRDAKPIFNRLRKIKGRIFVRPHATSDRDRNFTDAEIISLVQGPGRLEKNNEKATATPGSFLWVCEDEGGDYCEFAVVFEPLDGVAHQLIIVISALR